MRQRQRPQGICWRRRLGMDSGRGNLFDTLQVSAFRLETLPAYSVSAEAERYAAFLRGHRMPERSPRTSAFLARMAATRDRKSWRRVRVIDEPPTDYEQFEL